MFEWFKKKPETPKTPIVPQAEKKLQQLDDLYDAVNEMLNAMVLFYEKGNAISETLPVQSEYPANIDHALEGIRDGYSIMIRSQMETLKPPTDKTEMLHAFAVYDQGRIQTIPHVMGIVIDKMPSHLEALVDAMPMDSGVQDSMERLIEEAKAGMQKVGLALAAMRGNGMRP